VSNADEPQDFFADAAKPAHVPNPAAASTDRPQSQSPTRTGWRSRIKPVHVFGALSALALLWVVAAPTGKPASMPAGASADPAASRYADDLDANPPATGASARADPASAPRSLPGAPAASAGLAATAPASAAGEGEIGTLRAQVASLTSIVDAERAQHAVCAQPQGSGAATSPPRPIALAHRTRRPASAHVAREVLVDYHLNTIYNGQAWIERANRTFVVEAGAMVGDARVERIDAAAHVVETTMGDIR